MNTEIMKRVVVSVSLLALLFPTIGRGQDKQQKPPPSAKEMREREKNAHRPPTGPGFFIGPIQGGGRMFSILLSDGENSVTGQFSLPQVEVFEALLEAATTFALTDEKVGARDPVITRLMDQHEWSMFVDVAKKGNQSRIYVSLITITGKLTAEAGDITRGSKKEGDALLWKMLSQIREAKAAPQL